MRIRGYASFLMGGTGCGENCVLLCGQDFNQIVCWWVGLRSLPVSCLAWGDPDLESTVSQSISQFSHSVCVRFFVNPWTDCSTPGFPVHHQLPEFTQTHVHWVSDAIQPSHSLLSPSPPAFNLSQHQGLFKWVSSSYQVAKVLEFQL